MNSSIKTGNTRAPVEHWISAIEEPDADHQAGLARFEAWSKESGMPVIQYPAILLAFKAYDKLLAVPALATVIIWTADAGDFRHSHFDELARTSGMLAYWQERGFPPQCRAAGEGGFECD
jgi:hypothetical protein